MEGWNAQSVARPSAESRDGSVVLASRNAVATFLEIEPASVAAIVPNQCDEIRAMPCVQSRMMFSRTLIVHRSAQIQIARARPKISLSSIEMALATHGSECCVVPVRK